MIDSRQPIGDRKYRRAGHRLYEFIQGNGNRIDISVGSKQQALKVVLLDFLECFSHVFAMRQSPV
jgi:hypothetical protein